MQKKIIALAIAAAFSAPAFADTTAYGIVDGAVANIATDGRHSDLLAVSGGLAASRIGVNSAEDLGNGLKAVVNIEYGLDIETNQQSAVTTTTTVNGATPAAPATAVTATSTSSAASNLAARQQMLALAGAFGTVATGYLQTTGYDFGKSFDPTAGSTVSPLDNLVGGGSFLIGTQGVGKRASRALAYISPDMGGLTLAANYSTGFANGSNLALADGATTGLKTTATLLSANYKMDKLAAGLVYAATANSSTGFNAMSEMAFGASYDFEVAKLFATYQTSKLDNSVGSANTAMSISGVIPAGPGAVALSYATATFNHNPATGADISNIDAKASGMTAAWLQGLSKTTTFYAAYTTMTNGSDINQFSVANNINGGGITTNGAKSTMVAVGLNKKF